jgi:DNA modification methylase
MKKIDNNFIHCIITSPPYFNAKEYSHWDTYEQYMDWLKNVFIESYRILKDGRMCCVNLSVIIEPRKNRNSESIRIPIPFHFVSLMEKIGYKFLEDILWIKPEGSAKNRNGGFFQHRQPVAYKPNIINEYLLVFQKPINGLIDKIVRGYKDEIKQESLIQGEYDRTNVWNINPETNSAHPAAFPLELSDRCVKYYSYIGDIIFDPLIGSGTTALSAKKMKRNFIGFELSKKYCEIAKNRLL